MVLTVVFLYSGRVYSIEELPEGMHVKNVPFSLVCATPDRLNEILADVHQEIPIVAGVMSGTNWFWYVNKDRTTASFVVHKGADACLIFSGVSKGGNAFVIHEKPIFPSEKSKEETTGIWNN
jgi:hypothetical protein